MVFRATLLPTARRRPSSTTRGLTHFRVRRFSGCFNVVRFGTGAFSDIGLDGQRCGVPSCTRTRQLQPGCQQRS